jgi:hypothetical protein
MKRENLVWAIGEIVPADPLTEGVYRTLEQVDALDVRDGECLISTRSPYCQVADEPSAPLSQGVASALNTVFTARVRESHVLRDESEEL